MNILTAKRLPYFLDRYGSLDAALEQISETALREAGIRADSVLRALNRLEEFDADTHAKILKKRGITLITCEDESYPDLLRQIEDRPIFLYCRGDLTILREPCIALVGARDMTDYGKRVTQHIVAPLVRAGCITVSGLAMGIDAEVARETLRVGGKTVGIVGHGLGTMYPKAHERLADDLVAAGGLILSEFPLDTLPDIFTFPARNRIIAGLSLGTVVLQAAEGSGSLITADLALDYNRDVFAIPGQIFDPMYAGCHNLLTRGTAKLVTDASQILIELGMGHAVSASPSALQAFTSDSPEEKAVWAALSSMPAAMDELVVRAKLESSVINATLTILELQGVVRNVGGGQWVRT